MDTETVTIWTMYGTWAQAIAAVVAGVFAWKAFSGQKEQLERLRADRDRGRRSVGPLFVSRALNDERIAEWVRLDYYDCDGTMIPQEPFGEEDELWIFDQRNIEAPSFRWRISRTIPDFGSSIEMFRIDQWDNGPAYDFIGHTIEMRGSVYGLRFPTRSKGQKVNLTIEFELGGVQLDQQTYVAVLGETLERTDPRTRL